MKNSKFFKLLFVEIIVLGAICAYFLINSSDIYRWYVGNTDFVKQSKNCNLHNSSCLVKLKDGSIMELSIEPQSIPLMKPIELTVKTKNIATDTLKLKIFATNMNMGLIVKTLKKISKGIYKGSVTLPTCIVGGMIWNANIIANKPNKSVGAIFEFKTAK